MPALYVLHETAAGYALFDVHGVDELGAGSDAVQASMTDLARFGKLVKLLSFKPFANAADALVQINAVSEGSATEELKQFLELNLPKARPCAVVPTLKRGASGGFLMTTWMLCAVCPCDLQSHVMQGKSFSREAGL